MDEDIGILMVFYIIEASVILAGLLAIWAALGRAHWFVRAALIIAVFALLLMVPAHEIVLILLPQFLVAAVPLLLIRQWRTRAEGQRAWQFTLRDMLLFTFVFAAFLGIATSIPSSVWLTWDRSYLFPMPLLQPPLTPWLFYGILGIESGLLTLLTAWITLGQCRVWKRLVVFFVAFFGGCVVPAVYLSSKTGIWNISSNVDVSIGQWMTLVLVPLIALIVLWLTFIVRPRFRRVAREKMSEVHPHRPKHGWLAFSSLILLGLVLFAPLIQGISLLLDSVTFSTSQTSQLISFCHVSRATIFIVSSMTLIWLPPLLLMFLWLTLYVDSQFPRVANKNIEQPEIQPRRRWPCWIARGSLVLLSIVLFVPLVGIYGLLTMADPVPKVILPEPNAYPKLVELSNRLTGVQIPKEREPAWQRTNGAKPMGYVAFMRQHEKLLAEARATLELPSCVPLKYANSDIESYNDVGWSFSNLGDAFLAAGHARCQQGNYEQGTQWYVDAIRLGRKCYEGGIWYIDWECGSLWEHGNRMFYTETMAKYAIHDARESMPSNTRRQLIETLNDLGEEGEPFKAVLERDRIWKQHGMGWPVRILLKIAPWFGIEPRSDLAESWTIPYLRVEHRLLIVELALENYCDDHGEYPKTLDQLVPEYLDQVPKDAFTDRDFCYRVTGKKCKVYSAGPNGLDDGALEDDERKEGDEYGDDIWFYKK